jgi:hypothetical protein
MFVNLTFVSYSSPPSRGYFLLFWFRSVSSDLTLLFVTQGCSLGGVGVRGVGVVRLPQASEPRSNKIDGQMNILNLKTIIFCAHHVLTLCRP